MKITAQVPLGVDPPGIYRAFAAAFRAAAKDTGINPRLPREITEIRLRKGLHPAWTVRPGAMSYLVSTVVYVNPRLTVWAHVVDWYHALGGLGGRNDRPLPASFEAFDRNAFFPKKKPKADRKKREPLVAERLIEARERVEEWERKRRDAERALKLAKRKLRSYRAQAKGLERELVRRGPTSEEVQCYDDRQLAAGFTAMRG